MFEVLSRLRPGFPGHSAPGGKGATCFPFPPTPPKPTGLDLDFNRGSRAYDVTIPIQRLPGVLVGAMLADTLREWGATVSQSDADASPVPTHVLSAWMAAQRARRLHSFHTSINPLPVQRPGFSLGETSQIQPRNSIRGTRRTTHCVRRR